jgi:arylsulfatase
VNVIFISMDTLRADRLGCLGHERGLTPNLDRIAREGALFTKAFASDIPTQPSHTAIFSGRFGVNTSIVSHFHPAARLDAAVSWLPTIFRQADYATGAVDHLFAMKDWFMRGYIDYMPPPGRSRSPGSVIVDIGTQWLDEHHKEPFFLFLHFWDAHIPYVPPQPYKHRYTRSSSLHRDPRIAERLRSRPTYPLFAENLYNHLDYLPNLTYVSDLYDAEVAYLDYEIGRLFAYLERVGVLDETMVVLFGDHGENMTEHDAWFDHAGLYDSVVHVPLIIWAPGVVPASEITSLVSTVDIKPTVLDFLGMPVAPGLDGHSLRPLTERKSHAHRDEVFLSECTWQAKRGVRTPEWKFIRCVDPGVYPRDWPELYDVRLDPAEQTNLAEARPEIVLRMDALLSEWLSGQLAGRPDPMDEVVTAGLPAVRRLNDLIAELTAQTPHHA